MRLLLLHHCFLSGVSALSIICVCLQVCVDLGVVHTFVIS